MLKVFFWLRYLRKKRVVILSIAAVALSVALLVVVSSLFTGFIRTFERSAVEAMGDVVVTPPARFGHYERFIERLEETSAVAAATATLSAEGLLLLGRGNVRAVHIWGIQPRRRAAVTGFASSLLRQGELAEGPSFAVPGKPDKVGGFVGIAVIEEPNELTDQYDFARAREMIGQEVVLTTGTVAGGRGVGGPQVKRKALVFAIADVVFTGVYYLDKNFVYLPIDEFQRKLYPHQQTSVADQVHVKLAPGVRTDSALAQIRGVWKSFAEETLAWPQRLIDETDIETSRQLQSRYIAEIMKQMGVLLVIFGVVSLAVVLLVFCIFYMIVRLKQKDIAIMQSCGAAGRSVAMIFLGFGFCAGLAGAVAGVAVGWALTRNINTVEQWIGKAFGLKLWKSSIYMFSKIPNRVDWDWAVTIMVSAVAAVCIGSLVPAIIAARTRPVEILRYE